MCAAGGVDTCWCYDGCVGLVSTVLSSWSTPVEGRGEREFILPCTGGGTQNLTIAKHLEAAAGVKLYHVDEMTSLVRGVRDWT